MAKRNRKNKLTQLANYWQSEDYNARAYAANMSMLLSLAINRFRWEGLPDTCDARYLETQLHLYGIATLSRQADTNIWQTLQAVPQSKYDCYGYPIAWQALGFSGETHYNVTPENGELVYYSQTRENPWNMLDLFASKMTRYMRTEDINLLHQAKPYVMIAPQSKKLELENLLKQVAGFEPAILGDPNFSKLVEQVTVLNTGVDLIVEELARGYQQVLNNACLWLGIPHLAFEKGERMIEDEARANTAPTSLNLLNCLNARRELCRKAQRFGLDINVYFNTDFESYNFNYLNNVEAMAQDGVLIGGGANAVE